VPLLTSLREQKNKINAEPSSIKNEMHDEQLITAIIPIEKQKNTLLP